MNARRYIGITKAVSKINKMGATITTHIISLSWYAGRRCGSTPRGILPPSVAICDNNYAIGSNNSNSIVGSLTIKDFSASFICFRACHLTKPISTALVKKPIVSSHNAHWYKYCSDIANHKHFSSYPNETKGAKSTKIEQLFEGINSLLV